MMKNILALSLFLMLSVIVVLGITGCIKHPQGEVSVQTQTSQVAENRAEAIYFILIDRFYNAQGRDLDVDLSDPAGWHGGDLEGIRQKLPYLHDLGVTKIWISPMFTAASQKFFGNAAFHGYWTYDLGSIDKHFGNETDFKNLAQDAEALGIEIVLDFVVNHVGYGSPLVEEKPDWFHPALTIEDWNDPMQLTEREVHGLPDLNQDNPEVYDYLMKSARKWLSFPNIAGYRLDAVKHVGLKFWSEFNAKLQEDNPDVMLLGEYFDGDPRKVDEIQKVGKFTHMFDFPLTFALRDVFCEHKSVANLASVVTNDRQYSDANRMVTFLDNHDMPRLISHCQGDTAAMARALRVMLAWRGIPSLYYGTEIPLAGAQEPENRGDMRFENAEFYRLIAQSLQMRSQYPVLSRGKTATLAYEPGFAVIGRELDKQQALILVSQADAAIEYALPAGNWIEPERDHRVVSGKISVQPDSVQILVRNDAPASIVTGGTRTVTFKVPDDSYRVTGSGVELGQWNPERAPKPVDGKIVLELPAQTVFVYKPIQIHADQSVTWAEGDNRELFTDGDPQIEIKE